MVDENKRRPIRSRNSAWAGRITDMLVAWRVSPNAISSISVLFAVLAGLAYAFGLPKDGNAGLLIVGAIAILLRLLCNMFDGMVAVAGGRASKTGELFNEMPDRVADTVILLGVGYGLGAAWSGPTLGWCAALLAISTAYVRALGTSVGTAPDFSGPMAKPHRMQLLIAASVLAVLSPAGIGAAAVMAAALWIVVIGTAATVIGRTWRLWSRLRDADGTEL